MSLLCGLIAECSDEVDEVDGDDSDGDEPDCPAAEPHRDPTLRRLCSRLRRNLKHILLCSDNDCQVKAKAYNTCIAPQVTYRRLQRCWYDTG